MAIHIFCQLSFFLKQSAHFIESIYRLTLAAVHLYLVSSSSPISSYFIDLQNTRKKRKNK